MSPLSLSTHRPASHPVEIVERKGIGHPDTICDALAEELSRTYSQYCLERFGLVLHHNVDKALLCGGRSAPRFGGGKVTAPNRFIEAANQLVLFSKIMASSVKGETIFTLYEALHEFLNQNRESQDKLLKNNILILVRA